MSTPRGESPKPVAIFSELPKGATISTVYVGRQMKVYAVLENELEVIDTFTKQAATFSNVGSALLALAGGIWTNAAFVEKATAVGEVLAKFAAPVLAVIAIVFYFLAWKVVSTRGRLWTTIGAESKTAQMTPANSSSGAI